MTPTLAQSRKSLRCHLLSRVITSVSVSSSDAFKRSTLNSPHIPMRNKSSISCNFLNRFALFSAIFCVVSVANVAAQSRPFVNVSARAQVLTGDNVVIAGFIITSTATTTKQILIRGLGPSAGVKGSLADPTLTLNGPGGQIQYNNNWKDTQESAIAATGLAPGYLVESAMIANLAPGSYTATLAGNNGGTGVGVIEIYDIGGAAPIVNLSSRAQIGTGNNVLIGGMIIGTNTRAVIRAIGPSLTQFGIPGALQDPTLELRDASGTLLASNDNWASGPDQLEIQYLGIQPGNGNESAIIAPLAPGNYTAIVKGVNNTTGVGMVELYALGDAKYPRIFQAWANADPLPEDPLATVARHDLFWTIPLGFGWNWVDPTGAYTENYESETLSPPPPSPAPTPIYPIPNLRVLNPNIKILGQIGHYAANLNTGYEHLIAGHPWWKYPMTLAWPGTNSYLLDNDNPDLRTHVANQAAALMATGQFDGVLIDTCVAGNYLLPLLTAVRTAIGENGLIIINARQVLSTQELSKINGVFMENGKIGSGIFGHPDWPTVRDALDHNETITRSPKVNCFENWFITSKTDPTDVKRMRATTCLTLTHSNGYALFGNDDHNHMWYSFWSDHSLGVPIANRIPIATNADKREFKNGTAVWNGTANASVTLTFPQMRRSLATGQTGTNFILTGIDGDIYLIYNPTD